MGIYDRDYTRAAPPPRFGGVQMWTVNTWLIVINVAVFLINGLVIANYYDPDGYLLARTHPIDMWGYFSVLKAVNQLQVWRFVTFQFLHANFNHIFSNMLALFFFGPIIESYLGARRYLAFYLLCGIAGPLMYIVLYLTGIMIHDPNAPMVGASAGIFGVLIAAALVAPNATVLVMGIIPAKLKTVAWCLLGYAIYTVFSNGQNAGGEAAHIGGAIAGSALMQNPNVLNVFEFRRRPKMRMRG